MVIFIPHNDTLMIQAKEAFDHMDLKEYRLEPIETVFFGFKSHTAYLKREIMLPLTIGAENLRKIVMTMFTVVSAPSSYNILRRPSMNALIAVASTYHQ